MNYLVIMITIFFSFCNTAFAAELQTQRYAPIDVVYHGSINNDIVTLEPRSEHTRDEIEGAVVFATPSIRLASCYLFRWDDSWVHQSIAWKHNNKADYEINMIIGDYEKFTKSASSSGTIYLLPARSFRVYENKGLGIYECVSKEKITPLAKIPFSSALQAMKTLGVNVYFLNKAQFKFYICLPTDKQSKFLINFKQRPKNEKNTPHAFEKNVS